MKLSKGKMLLASLSLSLCIVGSGTALAVDNSGQAGKLTAASVTAQAVSPNSFYAGLNWSWPTDSTTITDGFGYTGSRFHKGVDIGVKLVPVRSAAAGVIIQSGAYSDGTQAVTIRHNTTDPATNKKLVTRYLHLKASSQVYATGTHIGQYVQIATSGNTGNVGYHLHFDVNNLDLTYPADNQTIDPMPFYPTVPHFTAKSNESAQKQEAHSHDNLGDFFDNNVIHAIGKDKFYKWFNATKVEDRTLENLKKEFNLTDSKINELTVDKVREAELKYFGEATE
ncbi:M23 family metallopeptidase [Paenibacillus tuaregi]|uniref:M23 family metallopeptidase n=1 Tax=Paenibacillus tuaregi TaxID=1816681 RepID=UPI0008394018|nr:M23 family metallopeptidase [Paenibacillus tuaregi]